MYPVQYPFRFSPKQKHLADLRPKARRLAKSKRARRSSALPATRRSTLPTWKTWKLEIKMGFNWRKWEELWRNDGFLGISNDFIL